MTGWDLFTSGNTVLNNLTKWATRHRGEGKTIATHQGKFLDCVSIVQALETGVSASPWDLEQRLLAEEGTEWCIMKPVDPLSEIAAAKVRMLLVETLGWRYSKAELVLCLMDGLLGKVTGREVICFRHWDLFRYRVICSKTANRPDVKLGLLPPEAYYWTPDDTFDWKLKSKQWHVCSVSDGWADLVEAANKT